MSYFKYLKKYWKLIVMNSVVHIYQRFYSIPLWCSWKVVQNLPGRFCDKRSVWQCHMIAWWTEKNLKSFFTTLYMGSLSMDFIVGIQSCQRFRWSYNCKILRWNWHFCRLPKKWNETLQMCVYLFQFKGAAILKEEYLRSIMIISTYHICAIKMPKGAILTSATMLWHGLIFCLERLPRNIVYKPRWSSTIEASEVALVVLTTDCRTWLCI